MEASEVNVGNMLAIYMWLWSDQEISYKIILPLFVHEDRFMGTALISSMGKAIDLAQPSHQFHQRLTTHFWDSIEEDKVHLGEFGVVQKIGFEIEALIIPGSNTTSQVIVLFLIFLVVFIVDIIFLVFIVGNSQLFIMFGLVVMTIDLCLMVHMMVVRVVIMMMSMSRWIPHFLLAAPAIMYIISNPLRRQ